MADQPLLECRAVSKAFGAVQALHRVDFEVRPGEVMALVGDNGAGKSTLIKGIAGIYAFDEGQVFVDGKPVRIHSPRDSAAHGIEVVYQDLALADNLDVVANMFLGREKTRFGLVLDESAMEHDTQETLEGLSVTSLRSVRQAVTGLSGGQRQAVAVAKSVMWNSRVVILDEPTAALGVAQTRQVLDLVLRLAEHDLGVVVISHNLHDIFEVADRITVLRLGQRVALFERRVTTQEEVVYAIAAGALNRVPGMATAPGRADDGAGHGAEGGSDPAATSTAVATDDVVAVDTSEPAEPVDAAQAGETSRTEADG
jgi:D-xylose transport system ATP-binding protein